MDWTIHKKSKLNNPKSSLFHIIFISLQNNSNHLSIMEYKNITDSDFIPKEYCYLETYKDLYQIAYSVVYKTPSYERVHDTIVLMAKQTKSILSLKAKLYLWEKELSKIVNQLKSYQKKNAHVEVVVPITTYYESLELTLSIYEYSKVIIQELQKDVALLDAEPTNETKAIPSIYSLFTDYIIDFQECFQDMSYINEDGLVVGETIGDCYEIIFDELYRRNLRDEKELEKCGIFKLIPDLPPFTASKNYDNEKLFMELFMSKEGHASINELKDNTPILNKEETKAEDNKKIKCGVLYYLLKDRVEDDYTLSAIINYCCNIIYNKKVRHKNNNSIDKYIRLYKKRDLEQERFDSYDLLPTVIDDIKGIINEYDLEIPNGL